MWLTLTGGNNFPEGARAQISVWKGEELDGIRQSLTACLEETGWELVDTALPLAIDVLDVNDAKMENPGRVSVKINMEDAQSLKGLILYHQKQDGTWEELSYDLQKATDTERSHVTFAADGFGPFLFVQTRERVALNTEPEINSIPTNVLISDNTAQIEEQKKQGQEPAPQMCLTLTGENDFPEGARAQISVWNEEELDGIRQSLAAYLEEAGLELVDMPLPLEINVLDAGGAKMENPGRVSVKISMEDAQSLKEIGRAHV